MASPSSSSSSESLPSEIIFEILSRLPVESLLRCKSACKSWRSLISDPRFLKYHLTLSTTDNHYARRHLLVCSYASEKTLISCPLYDVVYDHNAINLLELDHPLKHLDLARASICGSCNGLICLRASYFIENQDYSNVITYLFIWNPITRKSIQFPESSRSHAVCLVDGFGYDESSDDYKVVEIKFQFEDMYDNIVMMYSSKSCNWKEIGGFPRWISLNGPGVFLNGALHWIANQDSCEDSWIIVSLDLAKETYGEVLLPVDNEDIISRKADNEVVMDFKLGILGDSSRDVVMDCLCVLCDYSRDSSLFCADVWVMKVYGVKDSWFKLVSIPYDSVYDFVRHDLDHLFLAPLGVSDDGKVLLQYESSLLVFDSKDDSALEIQDCDRCTNACTFVESLVSPSGTPSVRDLLANACADVASLKI